jgi:hypothetical protein
MIFRNSTFADDCQTNSSQSKPQTFNRDLHNLHSALNELKLKSNWVLWRWELDENGNWKKPPFQPNGSHAKTNDPATWSDYPTVIAGSS